MPALQSDPWKVLRSRIADEELRLEKLADSEAQSINEREAAAVHRRIVGHIDVKDWHDPDYEAIECHRAHALARIRKDRSVLPILKQHYKLNPDDFIDDWGYTFDPRLVELGRPAKVPFKLFPKQREWIRYVMRKWRAQERGLTEKSRDCGLSWLAVSLGCTMCLHYVGVNIGYGSRLADYVDKKNTPKSLFYKARKFMEYLPPEFNGGWKPKKDAPLMRLTFEATESSMTGEGGDNIGRGDRASIYFVDEAAHLEQPESVEAALSQTTNCQMDISSVNGSANPFAVKRHSGKVEVFIFDWRDDPRKDDVWYQKQVDELDEVVLAQEVDRNYNASVEGIVIPNAWIRAAVDAHLTLKVKPSGSKEGALDVADEGKDLNAFCGGYGILIEFLEEWSGKGSDIFGTTERAFRICDENGYRSFKYDADGLGAAVKGDARVLNQKRRATQISVLTFRGSDAVYKPEAQDVKGRKNKDYFANRKAQAWWALRKRFETTFRAVTLGADFKPDEIISISSGCKNYLKLVTELSQPTYQTNGVGKIVIDKAPDGARSPNLADAVMIRYSSIATPLAITPEVLARVNTPPTSEMAQRGTASGPRINFGAMGRARGSRQR